MGFQSPIVLHFIFNILLATYINISIDIYSNNGVIITAYLVSTYHDFTPLPEPIITLQTADRVTLVVSLLEAEISLNCTYL